MNLMILSYSIGTIFFVLNSLTIKNININFFYKIFLSVTITFILSILGIKLVNPNFSLKIENHKLWISLLYFIQTILLFISYLLLPVSIALPLTLGSSIIFIDIFNKLINNVNENYLQWISNIIIIIGLILTCYSNVKIKNKYFSIGIILCIIWALMDGYNMVSIKKSKDETINNNNIINEKDNFNFSKEFFEANIKIYNLSFVSVFILSFIMIIIKIFNIKKIPLIFDNKSTINNLLKFSGYQIILSYTAFVLIYISLDNIKLPVWGSLAAQDVIFSLIIGKIFLNEKMGIRKMIGCLLIIGGIIYKSINTKDN